MICWFSDMLVQKFIMKNSDMLVHKFIMKIIIVPAGVLVQEWLPPVTTRVPCPPSLLAVFGFASKKNTIKSYNLKKISHEPRRNFLLSQIVKNPLRKWSCFCSGSPHISLSLSRSASRASNLK